MKNVLYLLWSLVNPQQKLRYCKQDPVGNSHSSLKHLNHKKTYLLCKWKPLNFEALLYKNKRMFFFFFKKRTSNQPPKRVKWEYMKDIFASYANSEKIHLGLGFFPSSHKMQKYLSWTSNRGENRQNSLTDRVLQLPSHNFVPHILRELSIDSILECE